MVKFKKLSSKKASYDVKKVTQKRKLQAIYNYATKYNYAFVQNNKQDARRKEEAAFYIFQFVRLEPPFKLRESVRRLS